MTNDTEFTISAMACDYTLLREDARGGAYTLKAQDLSGEHGKLSGFTSDRTLAVSFLMMVAQEDVSPLHLGDVWHDMHPQM